LQRHIDGLATGHAGSRRFDQPAVFRDDGALAVHRIAQRINDPSKHRLADGDAQQLAGGADLVALLDFGVLAEDDDADGILFKVEGLAANAGAGELDHFASHDAAQAVDARDAVADFQDPADFAGL
jgi:hypothetical protein